MNQEVGGGEEMEGDLEIEMGSEGGQGKLGGGGEGRRR